MTHPRRPQKPSMPAWLRAALETKTGGFRAARWRRCHTCHELTLTGLDNHLLAETATVDPTPITPEEEIAVILAGRTTYNLETYARTKIHLKRRDHAHGLGKPSRRPVVPEHRCGARYPGFLYPPQQKDPTHAPPF